VDDASSARRGASLMRGEGDGGRRQQPTAACFLPHSTRLNAARAAQLRQLLDGQRDGGVAGDGVKHGQPRIRRQGPCHGGHHRLRPAQRQRQHARHVRRARQLAGARQHLLHGAVTDVQREDGVARPQAGGHRRDHGVQPAGGVGQQRQVPRAGAHRGAQLRQHAHGVGEEPAVDEGQRLRLAVRAPRVRLRRRGATHGAERAVVHKRPVGEVYQEVGAQRGAKHGGAIRRRHGQRRRRERARWRRVARRLGARQQLLHALLIVERSKIAVAGALRQRRRWRRRPVAARHRLGLRPVLEAGVR